MARGGENHHGATECGSEGLEEVDLGVNGGLLFKEIAAEAGGIGGGIGAINGQDEKDHLGEG